MINFSNPFNGRKWLKLLRPHVQYGMLFYPNIVKEKDYMGFSFKSNELGLRGPSNIKADVVISGTSFAMGLSVDNQKNWYELDDQYRNFFNVGMPIGFVHQSKILKKYYKGSYRTLLFLYHPNIWVTHQGFYRAEIDNSDIFTTMGWKTDIVSTLYLYIHWLIKERVKFFLKDKIIIKNNKKKYHINCRYSFFPKDVTLTKRIINEFKQLSERFENVIVLRVPIKEQLALNFCSENKLKALNQNYDELWFEFEGFMSRKFEIKDLRNIFVLEDYLEQDTHWTEIGNIKFHKYLKENTQLLK